MKTNQAGFSLVEVLISLFVVTLLATTGALIVSSSAAGSTQLQASLAETEAIALAHAVVRQDLAAIEPRAVVAEEGYSPPAVFIGGDAAQRPRLMSFVRGGWVNPRGEEPRGEVQFVSYELENDKLVRVLKTYPDATSRTPGSKRILMSGIRRVSAVFWSGDSWKPSWMGATVDQVDAIPAAVRLILELESGEILTLDFLTSAA